MEKLRQLLNDYEDYKEKETWYSNYDWRLNQIDDEEEHEQWITAAFREDDSQLWVEESIAVIICKGYMFINWLVENDKINTEWQKVLHTARAKAGWIWLECQWYSDYESLLMLLSISDDPVSFLISILK